ncbi:hypothetical protein NLJ89_g3656 [Agrocybe chaxingu]|uniref:Uncharacterized protein n=1 Tax=Agrocybe chaxingu TaxID=84603 RepID=A0A9W8K4E7_9AGAR|nr:hypothetical protein NLJ89_g3656 [Agrocybe chaxingu]
MPIAQHNVARYLKSAFSPLGSFVPSRPSPHVLSRPPAPISARFFVRTNGTKDPKYCQTELKDSLEKAMEDKGLQQVLREELVAYGDVSGGVDVVATRCVLAASTCGKNPDLVAHFTSRLYETTGGRRYVGGIHSYDRQSAQPPTFVSHSDHGMKNIWKGTVFGALKGRIRQI